MRSLQKTTDLSTKFNGNMGVDISGLNPVIVSERPDYITNWDDATDEQREAYWEAIHKYKEENPGVYFSASWWSWRPIQALCDMVSRKYKLRVNTNGWGENSGYGLRSPKKCEELADAIEKHLAEVHSEHLKEDDDRVYLCLGSWCTDDGKFLAKETDTKLEEDYPFGTVLFNGVVLEDGTVAYPSHCSSLGQFKSWIAFLRNCGGFEIY